MSYSNCVVYFIDILGTRERNDFETSLKINKKFHEKLEIYSSRGLANVVYKRTVHTFSDCAYIIYDYKDKLEEHRKDIKKLARVSLYNTELLINEFIAEGFIVRGGVTLGEVYYEEQRGLVFGPAVSRAYYLESKMAIYPRIVLDESIVKLIQEYEKEIIEQSIQNENLEFLEEVNDVNGNILLKDFDGVYHLNYFNSLSMRMRSEVIYRMRRYLDKNIEENINDFREKPAICMKYTWLKRYYENSLSTCNNNC